MRNLVAYLILALFAASVGAQTPLSSDSGPMLTPIRITQLKGCLYLHDTVQTTLKEAMGVVPQHFAALLAAMKDAQVMPKGGAIFVYHGMTNPAMPITFDLGFPVDEGTEAIDGYRIDRLDSVLSATAIYMGPPAGMNIGKVYAQIKAAGHIPTNVMRIHTLYREDANSSNNIVMIEIPLQN
jgi:hypothetical protein